MNNKIGKKCSYNRLQSNQWLSWKLGYMTRCTCLSYKGAFFNYVDLLMIIDLYSLSKCLVRSTVWPKLTWIKVNGWWQILPQHQSTYLRGPESASTEIPPFRPHFIKCSKTVSYDVNLTSQRTHLEVLFLSKFGSERGDFNWCRFWASWVCILMLW